MIRAVIIDDESMHHEVLKRNLTLYCPEVQLVAEIFSGSEALAKLPSLEFDILFLDIELGDMNSFEMLHLLPDYDFHIIFITSFDQYAIQAFKVNAIDYLLKPVDGQELRLALSKAMNRHFNRESRHGLLSDYNIHKNNRLLISDTYELKLIDIKSIIYCQAAINYTDIYYLDSQGNVLKSTDSKNLKYYEEKLRSFGFIRLHQSFLANKDHILKVRKNPCVVVMSTGINLPVARERKQEVLEQIGS